ncbi:MAG: KaiC 1, partial [Planctomycetota bacterium]
MLTHLVDRLKKSGITTMFTDLTPADHAVQAAQSHVASLMDTWINLRNVRMYGKRSLLLELL